MIWVEGPIDAMYIEKWLTLYQEFKKENDTNFKIYKRGTDYSIQILSTAIWGYALVNQGISNGTIENYLYMSLDNLDAKHKETVFGFVNEKEIITRRENKKLGIKETKEKLKIDYYFCTDSNAKTKLAKDISADETLNFSNFSNCLDDKMFKFMEKIYLMVEIWNQN